ncbi:glycosyltransferase [Gloeobacter kilaueensis]|uniref:Dolichyl-phosphate beta-D-mannosyltransferase n=1 Tax=Gloeobacter kilaueensis (strain ATCC BAA-2537 / CCAP 1431/1 / ULC 316 / JS1) TaxID=1183438 RepID=U5QI65_GLOK1|nr:glycosyltransferase family 2 protein [Gloeobacter kilaueensis]AGY58631.1 dolichyl-phosphate beta-D-mannosyltransferase [Gloeobacter kilaueensis JS1]
MLNRVPSPVQVSLVLPTYNEAANLEAVLSRIDGLLTGSGRSYEIIVVDDDSPDRTWALAERLASERFPQLRVIHRTEERGLATAVLRGWEAARGEILAVMDADGQHPHLTLLELLDAIDAGADVAVGSRHVSGGGVSDWSAVRRFLSRGAQLLALVLVPSIARQVSDPMSGFFALRRSVIAGAVLDPVGYKILLEVLGRGDYRTLKEVGYVFLEREAGDSKVSARLYWQYLLHLIRLGQQTGELYRFLKFGLVGASGVVVNLAALWWFKGILGWPLWEAGAAAVEIAIFSNFLLNDNWTFRAEAEREPGLVAWFVRLLRFNAICGVGAVLNIACLLLLTNLLGLYYLLSQLVAVGLSTLWNYTLNAVLNWQSEPPARTRSLTRRAWSAIRAAFSSGRQ